MYSFLYCSWIDRFNILAQWWLGECCASRPVWWWVALPRYVLLECLELIFFLYTCVCVRSPFFCVWSVSSLSSFRNHYVIECTHHFNPVLICMFFCGKDIWDLVYFHTSYLFAESGIKRKKIYCKSVKWEGERNFCEAISLFMSIEISTLHPKIPFVRKNAVFSSKNFSDHRTSIEETTNSSKNKKWAKSSL